MQKVQNKILTTWKGFKLGDYCRVVSAAAGDKLTPVGADVIITSLSKGSGPTPAWAWVTTPNHGDQTIYLHRLQKITYAPLPTGKRKLKL